MADRKTQAAPPEEARGTEAGEDSRLDAQEERYYLASQWQLMWRKFRKHRLAIIGSCVLVLLYFVAIFADFFAINSYNEFRDTHVQVSPQRLRVFDQEGQFHIRPFVYGLDQEEDPVTWRKIHTVDPDLRYRLRFFVRGYEYKLLGFIRTDIHLVGVDDPGIWFPFGTDQLGRCVYSRTIVAARITLFVGLIGVFLSFVLGAIIGGVSGYFGGSVDMVIQRIIEFIIGIPKIPLWIALAAALPAHWTTVQVFFGVTIVLSAIGWAGLARVVRGKLLELREADFVMAARVAGVPSLQIITKHLLPSFMSYLIVSLTLGIPGMILGETALSFLQIGIRPPAVSWGVMLQAAQNIRSLAQSPWLLIPGLFVIVTVLCFNFVGDGLRDAADPYK